MPPVDLSNSEKQFPVSLIDPKQNRYDAKEQPIENHPGQVAFHLIKQRYKKIKCKIVCNDQQRRKNINGKPFLYGYKII